jgi:hypothetical protein
MGRTITLEMTQWSHAETGKLTIKPYKGLLGILHLLSHPTLNAGQPHVKQKKKNQDAGHFRT